VDGNIVLLFTDVVGAGEEFRRQQKAFRNRSNNT
jgi:hypothetical protein